MRKRCNSCMQYEKRIEDLEGELSFLRFELEELRSKRYKSKHKPPHPQTPEPAKKAGKKSGLFGHMGWFRRKPQQIDKIEEVTLSECPICKSKDLKEYKDIDEHLQEDVIIPKIETTLFRKHKYYCRRCKRIVAGKGKEELPNSYIGPRAKSLAVFLKYAVKISERDIKNIFDKMFNLKISSSSIMFFREQLKIQGPEDTSYTPLV